MFTRAHIAQGGPVDMMMGELLSKDLQQVEANSTTACRTAHLRCVQSFATLFFGTMHKQPEITQRGYIQHGAALQKLNKALDEPRCYLYDEVINAVMTLAMQETLMPTGPNLFLKHMEGLEKLVALRDPNAHYTPKTVTLYQCQRHMLLYAALLAGKPCILAKPEWKCFFHRHCANSQEEQEQQLYNILADCSVLASERDAKLSTTVNGEHGAARRCEGIRRKALGLCEHLKHWKRRWASDPTNTFIEVALQPQQNQHELDALTATRRTGFVFANLQSARTLMLYNVALMYSLNILMSLPPDPQQQEESRTVWVQVAHSVILDLCRILPPSVNTPWQREIHSSAIAYWAIQSARAILLKDESTDATWLSNLLDRRNGYTLAGSMEET
ncbi:hypothetical protein ACEQ8H_004073 [Pleosporales sp. CAS-2024a]